MADSKLGQILSKTLQDVLEDSDLRNFFESGGFIKPKILNKEKLEKVRW